MSFWACGFKSRLEYKKGSIYASLFLCLLFFDIILWGKRWTVATVQYWFSTFSFELLWTSSILSLHQLRLFLLPKKVAQKARAMLVRLKTTWRVSKKLKLSLPKKIAEGSNTHLFDASLICFLRRTVQMAKGLKLLIVRWWRYKTKRYSLSPPLVPLFYGVQRQYDVYGFIGVFLWGKR